MSLQPKQLMLYGAALLTLVAAIFAPSAEEPVQPSRAAASAPAPASADTARSGLDDRTNWQPQPRRGLAQEPADLFLVPRPPARPAAAVRKPVPVAPPLPYVYMGKMLDNEEITVFLTRQDKPYVVKTGDVLDHQYRVDVIRPPLMELTYLPLNQKQMLNIGASK